MDWSIPFWAVQQMETLVGKERGDEAQAILDFLREQEGFLCGRVIRPYGPGWWVVNPQDHIWVWRVQAMFEDCGEEGANHLPDGMRRVMLLPSMKRMFQPGAVTVAAY